MAQASFFGGTRVGQLPQQIDPNLGAHGDRQAAKDGKSASRMTYCVDRQCHYNSKDIVILPTILEIYWEVIRMTRQTTEVAAQ